MRSDFNILHNIWPLVRAAMVGAGLSDWLLGRGILGLDATRKTLAAHYLPLGGSGIEIGTLHCPLPLPGGAVAWCLDCHTAQELRQFTSIGNAEAMRQRNREHAEEHLRIAAPAMARVSGTSWKDLQGDARENEIERLAGRDSYLIHHHVFSPESFAGMLGLLSKQARIERIAQSSVEIVGVMRKLA